MITNQDCIDKMYMRRCIQLAKLGKQLAKPNPMVGAVIVYRGRIIGEGYHVHCGEAHAEVNAFASVKPADLPLLRESTLYVSLEPCSHYGKTPPCANLIVEKQVKRVVCGMIDPFSCVHGRGIERMREAGIEVQVGVLEAECRLLNRTFITCNTSNRPYILLKWAQTSNGYMDNDGKALAISSAFTKMLVHQLRSEYDAILVGRVTHERENPQLNVREWSGKNPLRLVLGGGQTLETMMNNLYHRRVQSLMVEGGARTLQSFIAAGLWDEIHIETAPMIVNSGTIAPALPNNTLFYDRQVWDGHVCDTYFRQDAPFIVAQ